MQSFIGRRAAWAYAFIFVILCTLNIVLYRTVLSFTATTEDRSLSHQMTIALDALLLNVADGETAQRGYLITSDPSFLAPYEAAKDQLDNVLIRLNAMARQTGRREKAVQEMERLAQEKFVVMAEVIQARSEEGFQVAGREVASGRGQRLMDELRTAVARVKNAEALLQQRHEIEVYDKSQKALWALYSGFGAAFLVMGLAGVFLSQAKKQRERANRAVEAAQQSLEKKVQDRTAELASANELLQQEIVQRSMAEDVAREQRQYLDAVLENMQDGVVACDTTGNITVLNLAGRELFQVEEYKKPEDLLQGSKLYGFESETELTPDERPLARVLRGESIRNLQLILESPEKRRRTLLVSGRRITGKNDELLGAVITLRDITNVQEAEEARRSNELADTANRAKSEFLSRMSHELRTPLNAILGFAQVMELDDLSSDHRESVGQIIRGGRHLLSLINEVLDISRIEAGRLALSPEPVIIPEALREAIQLINPIAVQRGISVREECLGPDYCVLGDRQRVKQVLLNLLSNAVKYNREGGTVRVSCSEAEAGAIRISITDTGWGISAENQNRVFVPFERLGAELVQVEGTGLGLALSHKLVEVMGGRMGLESEPDKGSTFWFELPAAETPVENELEVDPDYSDEQSDRSKVQGMSVLYIEDNLSNVRLVERLLKQRPNVRLLTADHGRAGIDMAKQERPDLICLDLNLPDMHGSEVLNELRFGASTCEIPIVIITADATHGQLERLLSAGAHSYLTKPIDVLAFLRLIDGFAEQQELATREVDDVLNEQMESRGSQ